MFEEILYQTITEPSFFAFESDQKTKLDELIKQYHNKPKLFSNFDQRGLNRSLPTALRFYLYSFLTVEVLQEVIFKLSKKELRLMANSCYKHILRDINKQEIQVDILSSGFVNNFKTNLSRSESSRASQLALIYGFKIKRDPEYWEGTVEM